jgi:hypothetical protein
VVCVGGWRLDVAYTMLFDGGKKGLKVKSFVWVFQDFLLYSSNTI